MKKYIIISVTLLAVLSVFFLCTDTIGETTDINSNKDPFIKLINENKEIQQHSNFKDYKNIAYKNSPYYKRVKYYIPNKNEQRNNNSDKTKTYIEISDYKLLDVQDNLAIATVVEDATYKTSTTATNVEMTYYYIFKQKKDKWFIYEQRAVTGDEDPIDLLKTYKTKKLD
ncbi:hypothetical protein WKH56_08810 [Priestia sp. SB1]|uniref:DUF4348 domain-containing protein n=1 Tax=Priestia aryabhattai TaxID=412384 RepID=A0AAX6NDI7_PRIAR|nr:hypothetical protein [Priestia aryabhattai]MDU9693958.1 hypothetical protein [Priestia aryabhattai]NGY88743.1 hypothetical protein [Priestia megaterium]